MLKCQEDENKTGCSGFTMLEVILSLSIIALLISFGINLLAKQLDTRKRIVDLNTHYHNLNMAMEVIFRDVQQAYVLQSKPSAFNEGKQIQPKFYFRGTHFVFATRSFQSYVRNSPESNLAFVRYSIDEKASENDDKERQKRLLRVVDTDMVKDIEGDKVGTSQVLVENIKDFKVTFWNGSEFRSTWDSTSQDSLNRLPKMVKIQLSAYAPLSDMEVLQKKSNAERKVTEFESIVFINSTLGQKEKSSLGDYVWQ